MTLPIIGAVALFLVILLITGLTTMIRAHDWVGVLLLAIVTAAFVASAWALTVPGGVS